MTFTYQTEREDDGRWLVEIFELPGCMAYGPTPEDALRAAQILAFRVLAPRADHDEQKTAIASVEFVQAE